MVETIFPKSIVKVENGQNEKSLLEEKTLQIGLYEKSTANFTKGGYIILDFGEEMNGSVRILTLAGRVKTRIRFGESVTETCSSIGDKTNPTNDHALRDFEVQLQNYSDMTFANTGFRFVRLDFDGDIKIKSVVAVNHILSLPVKTAYNGKDEVIKKIYNVAKRTVDLCASGQFVWDGVKRDRLVWIGDTYPEMQALATLYGRVEVLENSLDYIREETPLPQFMNNFPTYSMWWMAIVADYVAWTDAKEFGLRQVEYMQGLLEVMDTFVAEDGKMNYPFYFVDWPTHETKDEYVGSLFIQIFAVKKAKEFLARFGAKTETADKLLAKLQKADMTVESKKQVLALKYTATGKLTDDEYAKLIDGGAKGLSTFMSYPILTAIASRDKELAIRLMKEFYSAMLEKGATTFWEDFDMDWVDGSCRIDEFPKAGEKDIHGDYGKYCYQGFRHSLCHGWSAGVIKFIEENCM